MFILRGPLNPSTFASWIRKRFLLLIHSLLSPSLLEMVSRERERERENVRERREGENNQLPRSVARKANGGRKKYSRK